MSDDISDGDRLPVTMAACKSTGGFVCCGRLQLVTLGGACGSSNLIWALLFDRGMYALVFICMDRFHLYEGFSFRQVACVYFCYMFSLVILCLNSAVVGGGVN